VARENVTLLSSRSWERGKALTAAADPLAAGGGGGGGGRRRAQASFFQMTKVEYRVLAETDVSGQLLGNASFFEQVRQLINQAGDLLGSGSIEYGSGTRPECGGVCADRMPRLSAGQGDLVVGLPTFQTTVDYEMRADHGLRGDDVAAALQLDAFVARLNISSGGRLATVTSRVTDRVVHTDPIPPPPPPPLRTIQADVLRVTNVSADLVQAGDDGLTASGGLNVGGGGSFGGAVAIGGMLYAADGISTSGGAAVGQQLNVSGLAAFAAGMQVNGSLHVGTAATVVGSLDAGSLVARDGVALGGRVTLGRSTTEDVLEVHSRIASRELRFDADGTNGSLTLRLPDPSVERTLMVPDESGTLLSTSSVITAVGTLTSGNLGSGFGSATVTDFNASGASRLRGSVALGSAKADVLKIHASLSTPSLLFDSNADGIGLTLVLPDPSLEYHANGSAARTLYEACVAIDQDVCARARLNGSRLACTQVGACNYTAPLAPSAHSCTAIDASTCAAVNVNDTNLTAVRALCEDARCIFLPPRLRNTTNISGHAVLASVAAACVSTHMATCQNMLANGSSGCHGNCSYTAAISQVIEACEAADLLACSGATVRPAQLDSDGDGLPDLYSASDVGSRAAACAAAGRCVYTAPRSAQRIAFPTDESGTLLTSTSAHSSLRQIGEVSAGSLVDGFGSASVAVLISRGASTLAHDVVLGTSETADALTVHAHWVAPSMLFDANSDGSGMRLHVLDEAQSISFPNETGTLLTDHSALSSLTSVAALRSGSLVSGFGSATVAALHSTGDTELDGHVRLGGHDGRSRLELLGEIQNEALRFAAGRCIFTNVTGFLAGCTPDSCVNHRVLAVAQAACLELGPEMCGGVTSANNMHFETRAGSAVQPSVSEQSWLLHCGGTLTLAVSNVTEDKTLILPAESGVLLSDRSANSSLQEVGALQRGSLAPGFGAASVAMLESRGTTLLRHNTTIGSSVEDTLDIVGKVVSQRLSFGADSGGLTTVFQFPHGVSDGVATVAIPAENGSMLTSASAVSTLTAVGTLARGSIGAGFGDIKLSGSSSVVLTGANSTLSVAGHLHATANITLGDSATDTVVVRGSLAVRDSTGRAVLAVEPHTGDVTMEGDLRLGGALFPGTSFGAAAFNVSRVNEWQPGAGVTVEGVTLRNGSIPDVAMRRIDEVGNGGVTVGGVLLKDGKLYAGSVCLYTAASLAASVPASACDLLGQSRDTHIRDFVPCGAGGQCTPRAACPAPFDEAMQGDGCYQLDGSGANASVLGVSENTITSSKILDGTIANADLGDRVVTSRNADFQALTLTDNAAQSGHQGFLGHRWTLGALCLAPTQLNAANISVASILSHPNASACMYTVAPTGNTWLAPGTGVCMVGNDLMETACAAVGLSTCGTSCVPRHPLDNAWPCPSATPAPAPSRHVAATSADACHFTTNSTGYTWDVNACLSSPKLGSATFVSASGQSVSADVWPAYTPQGVPIACTDVFVSPGVRATHVTTGLCVRQDGAIVMPQPTTQSACLRYTAPLRRQWHSSHAGLCSGSGGIIVGDASAASAASCTNQTVASGNRWTHGGTCLTAQGTHAVVGADWLGACEGTRNLDILTLTNLGLGNASGNTETALSFRQRYAGEVEHTLVGRLAVGTQGNTARTGTYLSFATLSPSGSMAERLHIAPSGDVTVHGGQMTVHGHFAAGHGDAAARITLGDSPGDVLGIGGYLGQSTLGVDADGDGHALLNITFPILSPSVPDNAGHTIAFPPESGTLLTNSSALSTLRAVANLSKGALAPGFGRADVAALSVTADSDLRGAISLGARATDPLSINGFLTSTQLVVDTDADGQCLVVAFPDRTTPRDYEPTNWVFPQDTRTASPTFGAFLPTGRAYGGAAVLSAPDDSTTPGATVFLNDTVTLNWARWERVHLAHFSPNAAAHCPAVLGQALAGGWSSGGIASQGSLRLDSSTHIGAPGLYCVGGLNYASTRFALRVRPNPYFQYSMIDIEVSDAAFVDQLSWELRAGTPGGGGAVLLAAQGDARFTTLDGHLSVEPDGASYHFIITDAGADGILAPGYYRVKVDGVKVAEGAGGSFSGTTHAFSARAGGRTPRVWVAPPSGPGYSTPGLDHHAQCRANSTHTVRFPYGEDGTLLVKHDGVTKLSGKVELGASRADDVSVLGTIRGGIRLAENSEPVVPGSTQGDNGAVLLGLRPLRFGGELHGSRNDTVGTFCRDDDSWPLTTGQASNCSALKATIGSSFDCSLDLGFGAPALYCKRLCGLCDGVPTPHYVTGRTLTLGVPEPTEDLLITLPHESGELLTTASTTASLTRLGNLTELRAVGPAQLRHDVTLVSQICSVAPPSTDPPSTDALPPLPPPQLTQLPRSDRLGLEVRRGSDPAARAGHRSRGDGAALRRRSAAAHRRPHQPLRALRRQAAAVCGRGGQRLAALPARARRGRRPAGREPQPLDVVGHLAVPLAGGLPGRPALCLGAARLGRPLRHPGRSALRRRRAVPSPRHSSHDRNSGLAEICLRFCDDAGAETDDAEQV
jgi:hypothetical protein